MKQVSLTHRVKHVFLQSPHLPFPVKCLTYSSVKIEKEASSVSKKSQEVHLIYFGNIPLYQLQRVLERYFTVTFQRRGVNPT